MLTLVWFSARTDHELDRLLDALEDDYTLVLFSDSTEPVSHEPEFVGPIHTDMKRSVEERRTVAKRKSDSSNKLPLFEKYQFFTPGMRPFLLYATQGIGLLTRQPHRYLHGLCRSCCASVHSCCRPQVCGKLGGVLRRI